MPSIHVRQVKRGGIAKAQEVVLHSHLSLPPPSLSLEGQLDFQHFHSILIVFELHIIEVHMHVFLVFDFVSDLLAYCCLCDLFML